MSDDSGALSIDFLVGFTIFIIAFIWVVSLVPGLLINLQGYTIDYDAVAYRTGVILVEDPGAPADPGWPVIRPREEPWEFKTDKRDVMRLGLATSRDSPNILSESKVNRFFDRTLLNTTPDYRSKTIFGDYPYRFNISLLDQGQTRSVGYGMPMDSSYGYIQRFVKIKGGSNATINESFIVNKNFLSNLTDQNTTRTHVFSILINNTELHEDAADPLYMIDPEKEQIIINITDLNSTEINPSNRIITLSNISILNNVPISTFPGITISINNQIQNLPVNNVENVSLIFSPLFFTTIYDSQGDIPIYLNSTFVLDAPGRFFNSSLEGPYEYNYDPGNNVMQPQLRDAVLEVAIWSGETTPMVSWIITSSASGDGRIDPLGSVSVAQGASQTFTITPNIGSTIADVLVNGTSVGKPSSYTFTNVHTSHEIVAKFSGGANKWINSSAGPNGSIAPSGDISVAFGSDNTYTITPDNASYVIDKVTVDGVSKGAIPIYTFYNVKDDHTIEASFKVLPVPTFTSINPTAGPIAGGTSVTITGTDFTGATAVTFDGIAATGITVVNANTITATTPAHAAGAVNVVVTTPGGTATGTNAFTYTTGPTFGTINPTAGPIAGATSVTITGTGFTGTTTVTFDGIAATGFSVVSDTSITATTPAHAAGAVNVVVTTPGGTATGTGAYTYTAGPTFGTINPTAGPIAGATSVTITGTGFTGATTVTFDGIAATGFSVVSDTSITATTPAHAAGAVNVVVTTPGGTTTEGAGAYTYTAGPTFGTINPTAGPIAGGTPVTITGTGFTGATGVTFDGTSASGIIVVNDNTITATTPAHAAGAINVVITTPGGTATGTNAYRYAAVPTFGTINPVAGPIAGATSVTITGTGFTGTTTVTFDGIAVTGFSVVSDTSITATTPAHAAGAVNVVITAPGGTVTGSNAYTYVPPLVANFNGVPGTNKKITVTDTSTGGAPTYVVTLDWDWGDGSAHGSGSPATHTYASSGTAYSVTLTITRTIDGATSFITKSVTSG
jgi:hypothetical protein